MKSKHIPGPWSVDEGKYGNPRVLADLSPRLSWVVAILEPQQYEHDEPGTQAATARLIAAAPDLLAALEKADQAAWGDYTWIDEARAVIARAKGR